METDPSQWPRLGIVIPAFKAGDELAFCLNSLKVMTYPNWRLVVVNNSPGDNTEQVVHGIFPEALVIQNDHNAGYAGGSNRGWEELKNDCRYLAIVTQDIVVTPNWLEPIIDYMQTHEDVGAAQSAVFQSPDTDTINTVGNHINFLGFGYADGEGMKPSEDPRLAKLLTAPHEVTYASGAALVVRTTAIAKVGLFQSHYFMYHEDLDLGWRLRMAGYRSMLIPESRVYHRYDFYRSTAIKYEYGERNRLLCLLQNYQVWTLVLIFPMLFVMEVGVVTLSLFKGWFPLKWRGYMYILNKWPQIMETRRTHAAFRKRSDRLVTASFAGGIEYQERGPGLLRLANPFLEAYWSAVRRLLL